MARIFFRMCGATARDGCPCDRCLGLVAKPSPSFDKSLTNQRPKARYLYVHTSISVSQPGLPDRRGRLTIPNIPFSVMNMRTRLHLAPLSASIAVLAAATSLLLPPMGWAGNEVGYVEKFALSADREKVLTELVPGSEDYYFFHALHYQNTRNEAKLAEVLKQWEARFPHENPRRRIILNREALLDYDATPQQTLAYLKDRLNLQFNHQQEARDQKPNLPAALNGERIARAVYEKAALAQDGGLQSFSLAAIEALVRNKTALSTQQHRAALGKLAQPDVANVVEFIAAELRMKDSGGFGAFPIHRALLPEQLDALAKLVPSLATNDTFVYTKIR
jgi:hypothetical protein